MTTLLYVGVAYFSTTSPVSIGVFTLTLDRILVLVISMHYKPHYRQILVAVNICIQIVMFLAVFFLERTDMAPEGTFKSKL